MVNYSYNNNSNITIRDNNSANPYPSTIAVSQQGEIENVTVTLNQIAHTFPDDLDILLVGPQGQSVILM